MRGLVGGRESDLDLPGFAYTHADELILETGDESSRSDIHPDVATGTAFERLAIDLAREVDENPIALFDLGALTFPRVRLVLPGTLPGPSAASASVPLGGESLQRDAGKITELNL